ncbi:terpenoid synthase, partial [Ascodesmis nigricans]
MGLDYLLVHITYTIPPALLLTLIYHPLQTRLDTYKLLFILSVAILATIPWDSYLLHQHIWAYPPTAVLGPTLFLIPLEELFFFFIQTYNTALLYMLLTKPTLHVAYLHEIRKGGIKRPWGNGVAGAVGLAVSIVWAGAALRSSGEGTYMALIWVWAGPVVLGLWCVAYSHLLALPRRCTLLPIILPTIYLWIVDTLALRKGTWVINHGTKLNIQIWPHLEIEEAVFFAITNVLIVVGLVTVDYALALHAAFPTLFPGATTGGEAIMGGLKALAWKWKGSPTEDEYWGIPEAVEILREKSKSFYLASSVFEGRLRLDLICLYSFCRAADDLIDEAPSLTSATASLQNLRTFLTLSYTPVSARKLHTFVHNTFPPWSHAALLSLPTKHLTLAPLLGLLDGFEIDLLFTSTSATPIKTTQDLDRYAHHVAGTVGTMFTQLVLAHSSSSHSPPPDEKPSTALLQAADTMGIALQYINIARDIAKDALIGRCYIPASWLREHSLTPCDILQDPDLGVKLARERFLMRAEGLYRETRGALRGLPVEARAGAVVAVEAYVDIGRRLR